MTFLGLGVPIMQGYGLTETSPVVSVSRLSANEWGASGRPIPGVDVRIAADGEMLVRGRNVMQGYYRDPEATAAAILDGWLHTGDVGEIDGRGFLADHRPKAREYLKPSTGKWISPARIEASIRRSAFVAQAMVTGKRARTSHRVDLPELVDCCAWNFGLPSDAPRGAAGDA